MMMMMMMIMIKAFEPRYMLTVYLTLCIVVSITAIPTHGIASIDMIILVLCFESVSHGPRTVGAIVSTFHTVLFRNHFYPGSLWHRSSSVIICLLRQSPVAWSLPQ